MNARAASVLALAVGALVATLFVPPIPQDPAYHEFVDRARIAGVPNFWNVMSNLPFLFVGIAGLVVAGLGRLAGGIVELRAAYVIFFAGITMVAFGSGYYHLEPTNESLAWDRLPMTVAFMALFAAVLGEQLSVRLARNLLWPLLAVGAFSVAYWHFTELAGGGDLRLYGLVQFLPMLLIPLILLLFRSPFTGNGWLWLALLSYCAAKLAELGDAPVYAVVGIGGHAFKHALGAVGALCILLALRRRRPADPGG